MIVYRELSSLQTDFGISLKTLYAVSNTLNEHYRPASIPKGNGEFRHLTVPDDELKAIQRKIATVILPMMKISPYATAYRIGGSPLANAIPHVGNSVLLKLDISHFFDSIIYSMIRELAFPEDIFSEEIRTLLSLLCCYKEKLPQGAPTSPAISNIIMRGFDNYVGRWCNKRNITYTRYCDDMTFSGDFDPREVIDTVKRELKKYGFFLNEKKTVILRSGQKKTVTGIVVNEKINIRREYKKRIRQEMYYIKRFGLDMHLNRLSISDKQSYLASLMGRIAYVLQATPDDAEFEAYKETVKMIKKQLN